MSKHAPHHSPSIIFDSKFNTLFNLSPIPASLSTVADGRLIVVNDALLEFFGVSREKVIGRTTLELNWWVDPHQRDQAIRMIREQGKCHNFEVRFRAKSGKILSTLWSANTLVIENVSYLLVMAQDITERKQAEMALDQEKKFAENLFNTAQVIILVLDTHARIVTFNPFMAALSGYALEKVKGKDWFDTFLPKSNHSRIREVFKHAINNGATKGNINPILTKDGRELLIEWYDRTLKDSDGCITGVIAVGQDITERKVAEKRLLAALQEKEALLKEIHHRVKNNMQVISSLLSLQSAKLYDRRDQHMFQETQDRVRAMALIHERLYQTAQFARINFAKYLQDLARDLFHAYRISLDSIVLNMEVMDVDLGIDLAIPCGLVVNELITNCLKHAFPNGRKGVITISLKREDDGVRLRIHDDGAGLPPDLDAVNAPSFGLTMIRILTNQMDGSLAFDRTHGTACTITFKIR